MTFPEAVQAIPTSADPQALSLEVEGERVFIQSLRAGFGTVLFVVGESGRLHLLKLVDHNPRDAALGCAWRVRPRNVGAMADAAVEQMAAGLQNLFRSLAPGAVIQVIMHVAPTDRVDKWARFRRDAPDVYALNEFRQASLKEGLAHADGAKRWSLRDTMTLVTARLSAPVPDLRRHNRFVSLFQRDRTLRRRMNRITETVLAQVLEELSELRVACETAFAQVGVEHQRLDCAAMHQEISQLLQPWQRSFRCYDPDAPMREQLLSVPARTTPQAAWAFGPDETDPDGAHAWQARVMSLQQAPPKTYPGMLSSLHAPADAEPFAPWEALPDAPLTLATQVGVPDQADERPRLRQKQSFAYLQRNTAFGDEDLEKVQLRENLDRMMRDTGDRPGEASVERPAAALRSGAGAANPAGGDGLPPAAGKPPGGAGPGGVGRTDAGPHDVRDSAAGLLGTGRSVARRAGGPAEGGVRTGCAGLEAFRAVQEEPQAGG